MYMWYVAGLSPEERRNFSNDTNLIPPLTAWKLPCLACVYRTRKTWSWHIAMFSSFSLQCIARILVSEHCKSYSFPRFVEYAVKCSSLLSSGIDVWCTCGMWYLHVCVIPSGQLVYRMWEWWATCTCTYIYSVLVLMLSCTCTLGHPIQYYPWFQYTV